MNVMPVPVAAQIWDHHEDTRIITMTKELDLYHTLLQLIKERKDLSFSTEDTRSVELRPFHDKPSSQKKGGAIILHCYGQLKRELETIFNEDVDGVREVLRLLKFDGLVGTNRIPRDWLEFFFYKEKNIYMVQVCGFYQDTNEHPPYTGYFSINTVRISGIDLPGIDPDYLEDISELFLSITIA
jgi:hypothetical protein